MNLYVRHEIEHPIFIHYTGIGCSKQGKTWGFLKQELENKTERHSNSNPSLIFHIKNKSNTY